MDNLPKYIRTELGVEKLCKHCKEYFPATREFFYLSGNILKDGTKTLEANCKDCYTQRFKPHKVGGRSYNISHRYIGIVPNEYYASRA